MATQGIIRRAVTRAFLFVAAIFAASIVHSGPGQAGFDDVGSGAYGVAGKALTIGVPDAFTRAAALQADQRYVLAGQCPIGGTLGMCLARLNTNGALDPTFVGPSGTATGLFSLDTGLGPSIAQSIVALASGKLLVGGGCNLGLSTTFCVARLNSDGSIDPTWTAGTLNGIAPYSFGSSGEVRAMLPLPTGETIVVGTCTVSSIPSFCVAKLTSDGSPDPSFGGAPAGGGLGWASKWIGLTQANPVASALLQTDGKIVVTGRCDGGLGYRFCVARFNANGTLDTTFVGPNGNGAGAFLFTIGSFGGGDELPSVILEQPNGKLLIAGSCSNGTNTDFCAARLTSTGAFDTTFTGPYGTSVGRFLLPIDTGNDFINAATIQTDGRILLVGNCFRLSQNRFCAARLLPNGKLDSSFAGTNLLPNQVGAEAYFDGRLTLQLAVWSIAQAVNVQADGRILMAGTCFITNPILSTQQLCATRLRGARASSDLNLDGSVAATTDGLRFLQLQRDPVLRDERLFDIDGDGLITETDALIFVRALAGFVGAEVTLGLTFASNATRTDWTSIKNYLNSERGLQLP
jgi:uncharacterized delta-60 repeat protein